LACWAFRALDFRASHLGRTYVPGAPPTICPLLTSTTSAPFP
jgi:hypothetical protein